MLRKRKPARGVRTGAASLQSAQLADAVALLESGLPPERVWPESGIAVDDAGMPVVEGGIAAAARLARDGGVPLAGVLRRVMEVERDRQDAIDACEVALAGPRMSARVLAWLPLAGVGLATLLDPRAFTLLFTTAMGWVLLALGGGLTWMGRKWIRRLLDAATPARGEVSEPLVLALVEATLAAGLDTGGALRRVGEVVGEVALADAGAALSRGVPWAVAWEPVVTGSAADADEGGGARAVERALRAPHRCGASAMPALRAAVEDSVRAARRDAQTRAAQLGVTLSLPLTLCLLPAFVVVGIVPMVVAVVGSVELPDLSQVP